MRTIGVLSSITLNSVCTGRQSRTSKLRLSDLRLHRARLSTAGSVETVLLIASGKEPWIGKEPSIGFKARFEVGFKQKRKFKAQAFTSRIGSRSRLFKRFFVDKKFEAVDKSTALYTILLVSLRF